MSEPIASLESASLPGGPRGSPARLEEISLRFFPGFTALVGPSGAGKTSILNLLAGFEKAGSGFSRRPDTIGWAPADGALWPHLTAFEHLATVCPADESDIPHLLLDRFGLAVHADSKPGSLSEGERDRLSIARAIANTRHAPGEALLVLDEPLVHVEPARKRAFWNEIRAHAPAAVVFSTHDPADALSEADRAVCLRSGSVLYDGDVDNLYRNPQTAELAGFLGPANWFASSEEWTEWFQSPPPSDPACLRPEQIEILPEVDSPIKVDAARFCGSHEEVAVKAAPRSHRSHRADRNRTFFHRPTGTRLKSGDRVSIRALPILTLFLFLSAFAGCGGSPDKDTQLPVAEAKTWPIPPHGPSLPAPRSLTCNRDGEVFVLDNAGRVLVMSPGGKTLRHWSMPESDVGKPEGVIVLDDARVVVCDTHYHRLVYFTSDGKVEKTVGEKGEGPGQFIYPVGIAQDDEGNLFVGEYGGNDRIQKFTKEGEWILSFGGFGVADGEFQRPSGIVWHDGSIYVADAFNNRIQHFKDDGTFVSVLGATDGATKPQLHFPYDMVWAHGGLMVIEYGAGRLSHLTADGKVLGRFGKTGTAPGEFATPWGIAADSLGRLRVADTGNRRVVSIALTNP